MYKFNMDFPEVFGAASILFIFFIFVVLLIVGVLWIFSSLGLMNLAKKNNISNPWLAFLPIGYSYIVGKLGYEIYPSEEKKNSTFTWITFSLAIASFILSDQDISSLVDLALLVFHSIAFYNIFKALTKNYVVFTVFTVLSDSLLGGIFLYTIRNATEEEATVVSEKPLNEEDKKETDKEEKQEEKKEVKEEKSKKQPLYCSSCGSKLAKNAKFCTNCGKKINEQKDN